MILGENKLREIYDVDEDCYQPASIDLKLGGAYYIKETAIVGLDEDNTKYLPNIDEIAPDENGVIEIAPHETLLIEVEGVMKIPEGCMQLYFLRSSLMRMGLSAGTCVGDPGFRGKLMFQIRNNSCNIVRLKQGERFATAVTFRVNDAGKYDGAYQNRMNMKEVHR